MLSPEARAVLRQAWKAGITAEITGREAGPDGDAAERLWAELAAMAQRLANYPVKVALAQEIRTLTRAKDRDRLEQKCLREDLSRAEVTALLLVAGDREGALNLLGEYAAARREHSD